MFIFVRMRSLRAAVLTLSLRLQQSSVNETNPLFFEIICLFQDLPETSEAIAAYLGTLLQADKHSRSPPTETDKHE